jgi:AraC-like DNA-binding protein
MSSDADAGDPGTAPATVLAMLSAMRSLGLDVDALCTAAGIAEATLAARTEPVPLEELVPIWREAARQFGRGTLGLHVGTAMPLGTLLDYLAGSSATLRAALGQIARYLGLVTHNVKWVLGPRQLDGLTTFEERPTYQPVAIQPHLREFGVAVTVSRLVEWFDRRPREVWLPHAPQGPIEEYERVLGCAVRFERDATALRFDDETLEAPARRHDPQLFRLLESHAQRVLEETAGAATPTSTSTSTSTFRERVRRAVVERLREGEPGMAGVAQALATSERSLQRKLQAEGVSFRDVVDEARHKLAVVYLGDRTLSLTDVACLLGYSEGAAFTRAYKRWTGSAPSLARR